MKKKKNAVSFSTDFTGLRGRYVLDVDNDFKNDFS